MMFYLGSVERRSRNLPKSAIHCCIGEGGINRFYKLEFECENDPTEYSSELVRIRGLIAEFNGDNERGAISLSVYTERMKNVWVPMVRNHVHRWGADICMPDIRRSLNNVELNLGMGVTPFPPTVFPLDI